MDFGPFHQSVFATHVGSGIVTDYANLLTPSAANSKGSYVTVASRTAFNAWGFFALIGRPDEAVSRYLVDFAVGEVGSETIILGDVPMTVNGFRNGDQFFVPISIPASVRVAARASSNNSTSIIRAGIILMGGGSSIPAMGAARTYGVTPGSTTAAFVDPGSTANTVSSWSIIASATDRPIRWLVLAAGGVNSGGNNGSWMIDIGLGATGSETVFISGLGRHRGTAGSMTPYYDYFPATIPISTRISARCKSDISTSIARRLEVAIIGVH